MKHDDLLHKPYAKNRLDTMIDILYAVRERKQDVLNALEHAGGTHTFDDIVGMIVSDRLLWWSLPNSFCITEVVIYPQARYLNVFLAGGDLDEILGLIPQFKEYGKAVGCSKLVMAGRAGWLKPLSKLGWRPAYSALQTDIED